MVPGDDDKEEGCKEIKKRKVSKNDVEDDEVLADYGGEGMVAQESWYFPCGVPSKQFATPEETGTIENYRTEILATSGFENVTEMKLGKDFYLIANVPTIGINSELEDTQNGAQLETFFLANAHKKVIKYFNFTSRLILLELAKTTRVTNLMMIAILRGLTMKTQEQC